MQTVLSTTASWRTRQPTPSPLQRSTRGVVIALQSRLSLAYHRPGSILQVRNSDFHHTADATLSVSGNPRASQFELGQPVSTSQSAPADRFVSEISETISNSA